MPNKTKRPVVVVTEDDEYELEQPNVILTFPVFFLPREPKDKFVVQNVYYERPYTTNFNEPIKDSELLADIGRVAKQASELSKLGLILTDQFYRLRDLEARIPGAVLEAANLPSIPILFVEGPHYDQLMVSEKEVSIH